MRRLLARIGGPSRAAAVEIRPARRGDLEAIAAIERRSFQNPWSKDALGEALEGGASTAVLVAAGRSGPPLGYAILRIAAGEAEILSLAVEPQARRLGLGRALVEAAFARAQRAGAGTIHLEARVTNTAALALYRRLGFVEVGRRRAYYADGTDAYLMSRALEP